MGPLHVETVRASAKEANAALLCGQPAAALRILEGEPGRAEGGVVRVLRGQLGKNHPETMAALLSVVGARLVSGEAQAATRALLEVVRVEGEERRAQQAQQALARGASGGGGRGGGGGGGGSGSGSAAGSELGAPGTGAPPTPRESIFSHAHFTTAGFTVGGFTMNAYTSMAGSMFFRHAPSEADAPMGQVIDGGPERASDSGGGWPALQPMQSALFAGGSGPGAALPEGCGVTRRELGEITAEAQLGPAGGGSALAARARVCLAALLAVQGAGPQDTTPLLETALKQLQTCAAPLPSGNPPSPLTQRVVTRSRANATQRVTRNSRVLAGALAWATRGPPRAPPR